MKVKGIMRSSAIMQKIHIRCLFELLILVKKKEVFLFYRELSVGFGSLLCLELICEKERRCMM